MIYGTLFLLPQIRQGSNATLFRGSVQACVYWPSDRREPQLPDFAWSFVPLSKDQFQRGHCRRKAEQGKRTIQRTGLGKSHSLGLDRIRSNHWEFGKLRSSRSLGFFGQYRSWWQEQDFRHLNQRPRGISFCPTIRLKRIRTFSFQSWSISKVSYPSMIWIRTIKLSPDASSVARQRLWELPSVPTRLPFRKKLRQEPPRPSGLTTFQFGPLVGKPSN